LFIQLVIRRIADEVIAQITMGCKAYRAGDSLNGELHLSLANVALLKLQRLLDAPAKPMRKLAICVVPPGEEVSPAVDDERWDRVPTSGAIIARPAFPRRWAAATFPGEARPSYRRAATPQSRRRGSPGS
jgi:hypothetical protein